MSRLLMAVFLFGFSFSALAVDLPLLPEGKVDPVAITPNQPPIPCDQIAARLAKLQAMNDSHQASIEAFLHQLVETLGTWHSLLQPLEQSGKPVEPGQFQVLKDGQETINKLTNQAIDNHTLISGEMDLIVGSLRNCNVTNK